MSVTYRELERMGLGLSTGDWTDILWIAAVFGWRPVKTDDGADLSGGAPSSLITALQRARAVLAATGDEAQERLEVGLGDDYCECCDDMLDMREGLLAWFREQSTDEAPEARIDWLIDAVRELSQTTVLH